MITHASLAQSNKVVFTSGPHVLLSKDREAANRFLDVIEASPRHVNTDSKEDLNPKFIRDMGAFDHWTVIEEEVEKLFATKVQSFISTMNPAVLDRFYFENADDARYRLLLVRDEGVRNMTEEEADSFITAYNTGIQHVSEILRSKGLW